MNRWYGLVAIFSQTRLGSSNSTTHTVLCARRYFRYCLTLTRWSHSTVSSANPKITHCAIHVQGVASDRTTLITPDVPMCFTCAVSVQGWYETSWHLSGPRNGVWVPKVLQVKTVIVVMSRVLCAVTEWVGIHTWSLPKKCVCVDRVWVWVWCVVCGWCVCGGGEAMHLS